MQNIINKELVVETYVINLEKGKIECQCYNPADDSDCVERVISLADLQDAVCSNGKVRATSFMTSSDNTDSVSFYDWIENVDGDDLKPILSKMINNREKLQVTINAGKKAA